MKQAEIGTNPRYFAMIFHLIESSDSDCSGVELTDIKVMRI